MLDNLIENTLHAELIEGGARYNIEMSSKAGRHWVFTACRGTHCSYKYHITNLLKMIIFSGIIVPLLMVHPLS